MVTVTITDDKHVHSSKMAHVPNMVRNITYDDETETVTVDVSYTNGGEE